MDSRRGSTSQSSLHKILSIIKTVPPPPPVFEQSSTAKGKNKIVDESKQVSEKYAKRMRCNGSGNQIEGAETGMTLLFKAAKLVFAEFIEDDDAYKSDSEIEEPHKLESQVEELPPSPVVRTKRGRAHVLPNKFRDSVLEPLAAPAPKRRK